VVFGDSHFESLEEVDGVLLINVDSATLPRNLSPRRGHIGYLTLEAGQPPRAELVALSDGANDAFGAPAASSAASRPAWCVAWRAKTGALCLLS